MKMAFTSTILSKVKNFTKSQKESIKETLKTKGELPWRVQIMIALFFWIFFFVLLLLAWNPIARWSLFIIAIVGAIVSVELSNYVGKKFVGRNIEGDVDDDEDDNFSITQNTIILGDLYDKGGIVLAKRMKNRIKLTPLIVLKVGSISTTAPIFSSLSNASLQKISLKFHCSIVDTPRYEIIIMRGDSINCKLDSLTNAFNTLSEKFFNESLDLVMELQREKIIDLEKITKDVLKELFPSFQRVIITKNIVVERKDSEIEIQSQNNNRNISQEKQIEKRFEEIEEVIVNLNEDSEHDEDKIFRKAIVKEILLKELDFSLESFINTAKNYYKKAIEELLKQTYSIKTDTFLKSVHLFCDRRDIPFFFTSYSYLLKIIEFLDIELPSSSDIDNFSERLSEEYVSVSIPENIKQELKDFLDSKTKNSKNTSKIEDNNESSLSPIPLPPSKEETEKRINGSELDD